MMRCRSSELTIRIASHYLVRRLHFARRGRLPELAYSYRSSRSLTPSRTNQLCLRCHEGTPPTAPRSSVQPIKIRKSDMMQINPAYDSKNNGSKIRCKNRSESEQHSEVELLQRVAKGGCGCLIADSELCGRRYSCENGHKGNTEDKIEHVANSSDDLGQGESSSAQ